MAEFNFKLYPTFLERINSRGSSEFSWVARMVRLEAFTSFELFSTYRLHCTHAGGLVISNMYDLQIALNC